MSGDHVELRRGDRVALLVPGSQEYVDLVISLLAAGRFPVPLDPGLTVSEREWLLAPIRPALVVDSPEALAAMVGNTPSQFRLGLPLGRPMHVTSGTTGRPKAVFSGELAEADALALVAEERTLWGFCESDVNLVVSPLHHSAPLRFAMGTRLAGGRLVVGGHFDAARLTHLIEIERPTTMFVVPTHLQRLFAHWDEHGQPDLGSFRLVAHAGAPCPTRVKEDLIRRFPADTTWEFYGSTEGQFTACRSEEWLDHRGTVGRARPGRELSTDDEGHLWCVVPPHARFSYFGDPERTAAAWRGDAFSVGDVGRIADDGYVFLEGRRTDLIITGGVNVYPLEVENVLREAPGVTDVAVHGRDDDEWGQRVCASVVGTATEDALRRWAREHLAPAKRPKEYAFVTDLPRNPTGKVLRDRL